MTNNYLRQLDDELHRSERAFVTGVVWQVLRSAGLDASEPNAPGCTFTVAMFGTRHQVTITEPEEAHEDSAPQGPQQAGDL
jgi:hypothetical protein